MNKIIDNITSILKLIKEVGITNIIGFLPLLVNFIESNSWVMTMSIVICLLIWAIIYLYKDRLEMKKDIEEYTNYDSDFEVKLVSGDIILNGDSIQLSNNDTNKKLVATGFNKKTRYVRYNNSDGTQGESHLNSIKKYKYNMPYGFG